MKYDYLIVGNGLWGAYAGYRLKNLGYSVKIVEKRFTWGGNCYTENTDGIDVHVYGPHIFHTDSKELWNLVNSLCEVEPYTLQVMADTVSGEILPLPINNNTVNCFNRTHVDIDVFKRTFMRPYRPCEDPSNAAEEAKSKLPKELYEAVIKPYTEKQWGRKIEDLPTGIVSRLKIRDTWDNNYFDDTYQGILNMEELFKNLNEGIDVVYGKSFTEYEQETDDTWENVLYTGPVDELFGYVYGPLEWRRIQWTREKKDVKSYQHCAVMNSCKPHEWWTRTIEHKYFSRKSKDLPFTIVSKEYSSSEEGEICYPVNDSENEELYRKYLDLASEERPEFCFQGRLGGYRYNDMDDTLESVDRFIKYNVEHSILTEK